MSHAKRNIQLDYNVPVTLKRSVDGKVLLIQGTAIDDTVNENSWQVPAEELPYFVASWSKCADPSGSWRPRRRHQRRHQYFAFTPDIS